MFQRGSGVSSLEKGVWARLLTFSFLAVPHKLTVALANVSSQHLRASLDTSVKCIWVLECVKGGWHQTAGGREPSLQWRNDGGINEHHIPMKSPGPIQRRSECLKIIEEAASNPRGMYRVTKWECTLHTLQKSAGKDTKHVNITMQPHTEHGKTPGCKISDVTCRCPLSAF